MRPPNTYQAQLVKYTNLSRLPTHRTLSTLRERLGNSPSSDFVSSRAV